MVDIALWTAVDDDNDAVPPAGWPEFMLPSGVNNCGRAMQGALKRWHDQILPTLGATGTVDAIVISYAPAVTALNFGDQFSFWPSGANTGPATLTVNGLGPAGLIRADTSPLEAGDIGHTAAVVHWDGTNFRLATELPALRDMVAGKVSDTGDTMTGALNIAPASGNAQLYLTKAITEPNSCDLVGTRAGNIRWVVSLGNNEVEAGGNTGSDFAVYRYADAGTYIDAPLAIDRVTAAVGMPGALTAGALITGGAVSAATISATNYVHADSSLTTNGAVYAQYLSGGPSSAGVLRTHGNDHNLCFRWAAPGYLEYRIDESGIAYLATTQNVFNTSYGPGGGPTSVNHYGYDVPGTLYAVYVDAISDSRIKHNIAATEIDAVALLGRIQVSQYDVDGRAAAWLRTVGDEMPARVRAMDGAADVHVPLGLVAQHVMAEVPEAVSVLDQTKGPSESPLPADTHNLAAQALVPYLVRAVQQLSQRVQQLEAAA